jgi:branched-chain amino acid transport system ATP-binding protein
MTVQRSDAAAVASPKPRAAPSTRTIATIVLLALLVVLLALIPALTSNYGLLVAYEILQLAALAAAWNLMAGYGGMVTLAVAAFVGVGSYTTAKLAISAGFGLVPSVLAAGVLAAIFGAVISVPLFRFRGLYFTIASLVLAEALRIFMVNYNGLGGATGLTLTGAAPSLTTLYYLVLILAVAASLTAFFLLRTQLGMGLIAIRDDEDVAEEVGVSTFRTKLVAFVLSGLITGLVGGIQAQRLGHIEPYGSFSLQWTIDTVNATILGGLGTVLGPLVGAAAAVQLSERLANYPEWHVAITGALLIIVIRFAPRGIWGTALLAFRRWLPGWFVPREAGAALDTELEVPPEPVSREPLPAPGAHHPPAAAPAARDGAGPLLEAHGVGIAFGGNRANDNVEMTVRPGEVVGIVGPNGAGKSTFIGLISGALHSDQGPIRLFGQDATDMPAAARARLGVGRTHQVPRPFGRMTVEENLLVAQLHGAGAGAADARRETQRVLERCGLADVADVSAADLPLLRLKRLELARALALRPRLLLCDEIGAGLVESELRELIALLQELRHEVEAMIIVEHVIDVIRECCDRLVVLDRGKKLTEGAPDQVFADPEVAAVYLGTGVSEEHVVRPPKHRVGEEPLLVVDGVSAAYGHFRALQDASLEVHAGEVVALLGVNGAGKTTTARVISGLLPTLSGEVRFDGATLTGRPAHEMVSRGIAHCMEGRRIFGDLSVEENLLLGGQVNGSAGDRAQRLREVYELFPILREKRNDSGKSMSGGQQQMLAIGRALMAGPKLAILDEISLGLAPVAVDRLYQALAEVNQRGVAMIVIEQNVERGLALADRVYVIEKGRIALSGTPQEMRSDPRLLALYVGEAKGAA